MKPLNIVHLPSSFFPQSVGGTEVYLHRLCEGLAKRGHFNTVVLHGEPSPSLLLDSPLGPRLSQYYAVNYFPSHPLKHRGHLYQVSQDLPLKDFEVFLQGKKADRVHFHAFTLSASLDHARVVKRLGIPYFITYHTPALSCLRGTLLLEGMNPCEGTIDRERCAACLLERQAVPQMLRPLMASSPLSWTTIPEGPWTKYLCLPSLVESWQKSIQEFYGMAQRVIVPADWCREVLMRNGVASEKISILRQALPGVSRKRQLKLPRSRSLKLGFLGRVERSKGVSLLFDFVREIKKTFPEITCDIVGPVDSSFKPFLENQLARTEGVSYSGVLPLEKVSQWLRERDLLVVPSQVMETGPLVVLEAWDEGVPVIGARLGGIEELLTENHLAELLFSPFNVSEAVRAFQKLLEWPTKGTPEVFIPGGEALSEAMESLYRDVSTSLT